MSLPQARAELCKLIDQCQGCTREFPTSYKDGTWSRKKANRCAGCDHYEVIQAQVAAVERMQMTTRKKLNDNKKEAE